MRKLALSLLNYEVVTFHNQYESNVIIVCKQTNKSVKLTLNFEVEIIAPFISI
jgi:hypothetical protein